MFGQSKGLDPQAWSGPGIGGGLLFPVYNDYRNSSWFPSYKVSYIHGAIQGVVNIGNILFHQPSNKWNWYGVVGVGLSVTVNTIKLSQPNEVVKVSLNVPAVVIV